MVKINTTTMVYKIINNYNFANLNEYHGKKKKK